MSGQAYVGTSKRNFRAAVFHMLETNYGVMGSRRILEMLSADLEKLVEEYYPKGERISNGWMVFAGTKGVGGKAQIGKTADDHELVTIAWPVILPEDYPELMNGVMQNKNHPERKGWYKKRLMRIIECGLNHAKGPVLLTQADLSCMLGIDIFEISELLREAREESKKPLPTKGYYFDQGMKPTHKAEIISLYEAGYDEKEISQRTNHAPESVGNYIRGYERVMLMVKKKIAIQQISLLIDLQQSVVRAYMDLLMKYHPDLFSEDNE